MKQRNRAYRYHHRERTINRKRNIILKKRTFEGEDLSLHRELMQPGRLNKGGLSDCSCDCCKFEKNYDIPKATHHARLTGMAQEIEDYFNGNY